MCSDGMSSRLAGKSECVSVEIITRVLMWKKEEHFIITITKVYLRQWSNGCGEYADNRTVHAIINWINGVLLKPLPFHINDFSYLMNGN